MGFDFIWPWFGIGGAAILLALLFLTRIFVYPNVGSRWRNPVWLAVLGLPIYALHQFEEHGIDLTGTHYAFWGEMCRVMGYPVPSACPIPLSFITAVNVGSVWGAFALAALLGRRKPVIALSAYGIPLVNAVAHSATAVRDHAYNPGLLTALVLFLPISAWVLYVGKGVGIGWRGIVAIVLSGVLTHAVLMGSLVAFLHGWMTTTALAGIQIANACVPLLLGWLASRLDPMTQRKDMEP